MIEQALLDMDDYGEVINGEKTYEIIAKTILNGIPTLIGWTDGRGSHLDVMFNLQAIGWGTLQRGVKRTDLLVAVMSRGAFGFEMDDIDTHPGYYGEKLNMGSNQTTDKLAELINGVKKSVQHVHD